MPPLPAHRRIAPASHHYRRRSRTLLIAAPLACFVLLTGAVAWWLSADLDIRWPLPGSEPLSLASSERASLQQQHEALRVQWLHLDAQDAQSNRALPALSPAVRQALQPGAALPDHALRDHVDLLSRLLDERLFARPALAAPSGKAASRRLMPVAGVKPSSSFGLRLDPFSGRASMHNGVDFVAPAGTAIRAAEAGVVRSAGLLPQFGWSVELDHGRGITTRYAHALRLLVRPGQSVAAGQQIAEVGSTGKSTGPHLHFEVRYNGTPLNPLRYLASR